ncbi:unnamed protein product [Leptosia nina]|uniref:Uncharacterized protein n=1 Tax=Leptosia nina TaxID=320188 RepID=A0AAV1JAN8_9NEOP
MRAVEGGTQGDDHKCRLPPVFQSRSWTGAAMTAARYRGRRAHCRARPPPRAAFPPAQAPSTPPAQRLAN